MAQQKLNKKLVVVLTIVGMVVMAGAMVVMVKMLPERDPKPMAAQGEKLAAQGQYEQARQCFVKAAQRAASGTPDPAAVNAYRIRIGDMFLALGKAADAVGNWRKVVQDDASNETAQGRITQFVLDFSHLSRSGWETVQSEAELLCKMNPQNALGQHALGRALVEQRSANATNATKGQELLKQAFESDKGNPDYADTLARLLDNEGKTAEAFDVYATLLTNIPADPDKAAKVWRYRGQFYLGKLMKNAGEFLHQKSQNGSPAELAKLHEQTDQMDKESLTSYTKALELMPTNEENLIGMGQYWTIREAIAEQRDHDENAQKQCWAKAREFYEQAVKTNPDGYDGYRQLARLYATNAEYENGFKVLKERMDRPLERSGYLGWRNKIFMAAIRDEAFRYTIAQAETLNNTAADYTTKMQELIARLNDVYGAAKADAAGGESDPMIAFMKGRLVMLQGEVATAVKEFEKADKLTAGANPEIKQYLAQLYLQIGELGSAQETVEQVLNAYPNSENAWVLSAEIQMQLAQPERALMNASQALKINPKNRKAMLVQMRAYESQQNYEMVDKIRQQLNIEQESPGNKLLQAMIARMQGEDEENPNPARLAEAEKLFREILKTDPLNLQALRHLISLLSHPDDTGSVPMAKQKEIMQLLEVSTQAIDRKIAEITATQPEGGAPFKAIKSSLERLRVFADTSATPEQKTQRLEDMIKAGSDPFMVQVELFQLCARDPARATEAYEHLKQAFQLRPDEPSLVDTLFVNALNNKDWAMAETCIEKANKLKLTRAGGRFYRGRLMIARTDLPNHLEEAVREIRAGLADFPTYSQGHAMLGQALALQQKYDQAETAYREAFRLNPRNAAAVLALANLAGQRNDQSAKAQYLEICAQMIPNNPWVKAELLAAEDLKDPKIGIARREQLRKDNPKDVENLLNLAQLYRKQERFDEAAAIYDQLRQSQPTDLRILQNYVQFLRSKIPPDNAGAEKVLTEATQAAQEPALKAATQLLLANHLEWVATSASSAAQIQAVDAAYSAAAKIADSVEVNLDTGMYYLRTKRPEKAEPVFRHALELAKDASLETKTKIHRYLLESLLVQQTPESDTALQKELQAYNARNSEDSFALLIQGEDLGDKGKLREALAVFTDYINKNQGDALGYFKRGQINAQCSRWELAIADFKQAKALRPDGFNYEHRWRLARCMTMIGQGELAITELLAVIKETENNTIAIQDLYQIYVNNKRWKEAEELIKPRMDRDPSNFLWPQLLAQTFYSRSDAEQTIKYARIAAERSQYAPPVVDSLLQSYAAFKQYDALIRDVGGLPEAVQKHPQIIKRVAAAYAAKQERETALTWFNKAAEACVNDLETFTNVIMFAKASLDVNAAEELVRKRLAANPNEIAAKFALAFLEKQKNQSSNQFVPTIQALIETVPAKDEVTKRQRTILLQSLAEDFYQNKKYAEARQYYEEMLKLDENNVMALNNLAYLLMDGMNDLQGALKYAERAAALHRNNPNILDTLGWNYTLAGKLDEGIISLRQSISLAPETAATHYHLAEALHRRSTTASGTNQQEDIQESTIECRRAHELIMKQGPDTEGTFERSLELGEKLGLTLNKTPPASGGNTETP